MSIYTISDLHLSLSANKSMEVFRGWENYTERLAANWNRVVGEYDTVVLVGDTSWALKLSETKEDFSFLNRLNGQKILIKGNHDFWWGTAKKMQEYFAENRFDTLKILHNNCIIVDDVAVCGTRGWLYDGNSETDKRVIARECGRLEQSLMAAQETDKEPIVFLHYPPVYGEYVNESICELLIRYNITKLFYGHIHGMGKLQAPNSFENIKMRLVSCDCVDFTPVFVG